MKMWLILAAVLILLPGCSSIGPDEGRRDHQPTIHFHPYQPPKPPDNSITSSYTVFLSDKN